MDKKIVALIPARYAATRFPAKLMKMLGDKPVICHTYEATKASGLFTEVYVVTDSPVIFDTITAIGGKAIMSTEAHESGSDRIAAAAKDLDVDVVVNVQGDEPFIKTEPLAGVVRLFDNPDVQVASLMRRITNPSDLQNPNIVKVVTDHAGRALYFSRSVIPYQRDTSIEVPYFLHVGVYAFTKKALLQFTQWPPAILEQTEKLEQLRILYNGLPIYMAETTYENVAIDTPEDLEHALSILQKR